MAIIVFVGFTGAFIGVMVLKNTVQDILNSSLSSDNAFSTMYRKAYGYEMLKGNTSLYLSIPSCNTSNVLVHCDKAIELVYEGSKPTSWAIGLAGAMESALTCAGINETANNDYYFRGERRNPGDKIESCKHKVQTFINGTLYRLYLMSLLEKLSSAAVIAVSVIIILILFLNTAGGYCLCCHPDRKDAQPTFTSPGYNRLP